MLGDNEMALEPLMRVVASTGRAAKQAWSRD